MWISQHFSYHTCVPILYPLKTSKIRSLLIISGDIGIYCNKTLNNDPLKICGRLSSTNCTWFILESFVSYILAWNGLIIHPLKLTKILSFWSTCVWPCHWKVLIYMTGKKPCESMLRISRLPFMEKPSALPCILETLKNATRSFSVFRKKKKEKSSEIWS